MNDLISIIVSVYNIEKYIIDCLNSINKQTYENIEVIIVNDGSTDNTLNLINDYIKEKDNFKVFTKKNGGPSSARNYGMKKINGKYFMYVDGDDVLDKYCVEHLYKNILESSADTSICNYEKFFSDYSLCDNADCSYKEFSVSDYYKKILNFEVDTYVWGILFPSKFKDYIHFTDGIYFEDLFVFSDILSKCKKICYSDKKMVKYRQNNNSIVHVYSEKKVNDYIMSSKKFCSDVELLNKSYNNLCCKYLANTYMTAIYLSIFNDEKLIEDYKRKVREYIKNVNVWDIKGSIGIKFKLFKFSTCLGVCFLKLKKRVIR